MGSCLSKSCELHLITIRRLGGNDRAFRKAALEIPGALERLIDPGEIIHASFLFAQWALGTSWHLERVSNALKQAAGDRTSAKELYRAVRQMMYFLGVSTSYDNFLRRNNLPIDNFIPPA